MTGGVKGYPVISSQQLPRSLLRKARTALVFRLRLTLVLSSAFDHSGNASLRGGGGIVSELVAPAAPICV